MTNGVISKPQGRRWMFFVMLVSWIPVSMDAISIQVIRPEQAEVLSMPIGFTFVVGTVEPSNSRVQCNGVTCEVDADGAFIGFAPIRRISDFFNVKNKICDAQFEFVVQSGGEEFKTVIPTVTPCSPSAAIPAQEAYEPARWIRVMKDQWFGLEGERLGEMIYVRAGAVLKTIYGGAAGYRCRVDEKTEMTIPNSDAEMLEKEEVHPGFSILWFRGLEDTRVEWMDMSMAGSPKETIKQTTSTKSPWGFEWLQENDGFKEHGKLHPQNTSLVSKVISQDASRSPSPLQGIRVCLDPGHHPDRGAVGPRGFEERESTLWIARETAILLEQEGAQVTFTREEEPLVLKQRHERIHQLHPDLVVSIHNNSVGDGQDPRLKHGTQTFYLHPWSKPLAEAVHCAMLKKLGTTDLGCIRRNLYVTRFPECPTILVEPEYIILPSQEKKFMDAEYRHLLAESIVDGIRDFVKSRISL